MRLLLGADTGQGGAWFLLAAGQPGVTVTSRAPLDFSRSLASVRLTGLVIGPDQILPGLSTAGVRDLAATLYAAEAPAVAGWCCAHRRPARPHPPPVRPAHRLVPGGQAPVRRDGLPRRARRRAGLGRGAGGRRGARTSIRWPRRPRRPWRWTTPWTTPRTASRCSAGSASPGSTTPICTCAGRWRCASCSAAAAAWRARAAELALAGARRRLGVNLASTDAGPIERPGRWAPERRAPGR